MSLENLKKEIGQRMRLILKENGVSQEKASKVLGLDSQTRLYYYLSGRSCMDYELLLKFSKEFNVSLPYLFGIEPEKSMVYKILQMSNAIDKVVPNMAIDDKSSLILEFLKAANTSDDMEILTSNIRGIING